MYKIHIGESYIIALKDGHPRGMVVTLKGLKEGIDRGLGPGIINSWTLTHAAAAYWADYKSKAFENDSNKSYPVD